MATTTTRPAYREPWTHGAAAYIQADTFAAALEGMKRKRKGVIFHMPNSGEAGQHECVVCGGKLAEPARAVEKPANEQNVIHVQSAAQKADKNSTWNYDAKNKKVYGGRHYLCSWSALMVDISTLGRKIGG